MKTAFKTQKGTELPIMNIKGKEYLQVAHRMVWFREEHPDWGIQTKLDVDFEKRRSIAHAEILDTNGRVIASAHKVEDEKGFGDFVEKSETGAIGRALAMCGYGTQFADDFDEGDRLADAPTPGRLPESKPKITTNHQRELLNKELLSIYKPFLTLFPQTNFPEILMTRYGAAETRLMATEQIQDLIKWMKLEMEKKDAADRF